MSSEQASIRDAGDRIMKNYREVLGHYPTGVVVVTAVEASGKPLAMVIGSFTSVSLDPPLVGFFPSKSSSSYQQIKRSNSFCINVLSADQEWICRALSSKVPDKYEGIGWRPAASGAPILDEAVAWIDCEVEQRYDGGDHDIVLGRVQDLAVQNPALPLVFFQGGYGQFSPLSFPQSSGLDLIPHLRVVELIRADIQRLSTTIRREILAMAPIGDHLQILESVSPAATGSQSSLVGRRVPFVPPNGSLFVAFDEESAREKWVARAPDAYTDRTEVDRIVSRVRERGWSVAIESSEHRHLDRLLSAFSGGPHTPAVERQLLQVIGVLRSDYDCEAPTDGERPVRMIAVPVFGKDGGVVLQLVVHSLSGSLSWNQLEELRRDMLEAANRASERCKLLA